MGDNPNLFSAARHMHCLVAVISRRCWWRCRVLPPSPCSASIVRCTIITNSARIAPGQPIASPVMGFAFGHSPPANRLTTITGSVRTLSSYAGSLLPALPT